MAVRAWMLTVTITVLSGCGQTPTPTSADSTPASSSTSSGNTSRPSSKTNTPNPPAEQTEPEVVRFTVAKEPNYVNVMGKNAPPIPEFPPLEKKPGILRGHVKDAAGKPLQGAVIGVRSTAVGGVYSGASAETNENGYYEVLVPRGAAHFYAAGYTVDYADGRAAMALHPADGKLTSFVSTDGSVENFVLWNYGIADRDKMSENPGLSNNFYGGALYIGHHTADPGDALALPSNLRTGTEIEVTLKPEGRLLDGSVGKTFVIKKAVYSSGFTIQNISIGRYRLSVRRADGQPLLMRLNKPQGLTFGITPTETTDSAILSLHPGGAKAGMVTPGLGNWNLVEVYVEIPKGK